LIELLVIDLSIYLNNLHYVTNMKFTLITVHLVIVV